MDRPHRTMVIDNEYEDHLTSTKGNIVEEQTDALLCNIQLQSIDIKILQHGL